MRKGRHTSAHEGKANPSGITPATSNTVPSRGQDRGIPCGLLRILLHERASDDRVHSKCAEEVRRDGGSCENLRLLAAGDHQVFGEQSIRRQVLDGCRARSVVPPVLGGDGVGVTVGGQRAHPDELVGLRIGKGLEQHRVHHAEHGGVGSEAEGEDRDEHE
jgi:hypothetical protein